MKKILSLALAVLMLVSALPVAYATNVYENPDENTQMGTAVSYTADSEANRNYTITVPAELQPGQSGTVTLKGMWASNETVKVTADTNVELTNSINAADKHTLDIEFAGIEKAGDNTVEKTYTETVKVASMPADALFGTWSGKFNYNVELVEEAAELISFTMNGTTYQAKDGMTWDEFVNSDYNTDSTFYLSVGETCVSDGPVYYFESEERVYSTDVITHGTQYATSEYILQNK